MVDLFSRLIVIERRSSWLHLAFLESWTPCEILSMSPDPSRKFNITFARHQMTSQYQSKKKDYWLLHFAPWLLTQITHQDILVDCFHSLVEIFLTKPLEIQPAAWLRRDIRRFASTERGKRPIIKQASWRRPVSGCVSGFTIRKILTGRWK